MSYQTLISVEELQSLQRSARPALLFDARFDLADTFRRRSICTWTGT